MHKLVVFVVQQQQAMDSFKNILQGWISGEGCVCIKVQVTTSMDSFSKKTTLYHSAGDRVGGDKEEILAGIPDDNVSSIYAVENYRL